MKGKIYLITNSVDEMVYVGSTTQSLSDRMCNHRSQAKLGRTNDFHEHMRKIGFSKFTIQAIKIRDVKNRRELERLEFHCMQDYPRESLLNMNTVSGELSVKTRKRMSISQRGDKTTRFKRGSIAKINCIRDGINHTVIKFQWCIWNNDILTRKSKQFSIEKHGEHAARRMAEKLRNEIYPITE